MFDDRLATVLRMRAGSEATLRTQFRQLVDLLGTRDAGLSGRALARLARSAANLSAEDLDAVLIGPARKNGDRQLAAIAGFVRLHLLQAEIAQETQSEILREPGLRLRSPEFVAFLALGDPKPAAAVVATARLTQEQWLDLIPRLPVTARGFLRHRRDLSAPVKLLLKKLGVGDLVLPMWPVIAAQEARLAARPIRQRSPLPPPPPPMPEEGIGALRQRIAAFQEGRQFGRASPRLPVGNVGAHADPIGKGMLDCRDRCAGQGRAGGRYCRADALRSSRLPRRNRAGWCVSKTTSPFGCAAIFRCMALLSRLTPHRESAVNGAWMQRRCSAAIRGTSQAMQCVSIAPTGPTGNEEANTQADAMRQVLHELGRRSMRSRVSPRSYSSKYSEPCRTNTAPTPPPSRATRRS